MSVGKTAVFILGAAIGTVTTLAWSQSRALDPLRVAPHVYRLELENNRVRVLRSTIRNGETQPLHAHPDRVLVHLSPCAWLTTGEDGQTTMSSFDFGQVLWQDSETHGGETRNVVQECRVLEIELKNPAY